MNRNFLLSNKVFRIIAIVIIGIPLLASSQVNSNLPINAVEDFSFQKAVESSLVDLESSVPLKGSNSENGGEGGGGVIFYNSIIGMYSRTQKTWYLKHANNDGWENISTVRFGSTDSSWIPVAGDWNGDGKDTIGMYSRTQKTWYLKGANNDGWGGVTTVRFGSTDSSWIPVAGDWNGNGTDTIGMYSRTQKTWYLKDANTDGWTNFSTVRFGSVDSSWIPVVGDWNDNGTDTIGMYSRTQKTWYLKDTNTDGWTSVSTVRFGSVDTSWTPVVGDWDGNGTDTVGMYSRTQKTWYLKDANTDGWANVTTVRFGSVDSSWTPVVGDWDGQEYAYTDFVYESVWITAGSTGTATATCTEGSVLVSGGYAGSTDVNVYTHSKNGNGWRAYGKNNAGVSKLMNVYATCLYNVPAYTTQVWDQVSVPTMDIGNPVAACPSGNVVTGGGWASVADGSLRVYNSSKESNGWQVWAENSSGSSKLLNSYAICLSGVSASITEVMESIGIDPGNIGSATPTCVSGYVSGGGFASQPDLVMYNTTPHPGDSEWWTYAKNFGFMTRTMFGYVECLTFP